MKRIIYFYCVLMLIIFNVTSAWARSKVEIAKNVMGQYQLLVNGQLYFIRGVCYHPVPIGGNADYNFCGDQNRPWLLDGQMMKEAGINTVRFYQPGENIYQTKRVITDLYKNFEISTIMGHWLDWWQADYANPQFQELVTKEVLDMVRAYKDTPGLLMWVLGNENNYSFGPQKINYWTSPELERISDPYKKKIAQAKIYYSFVNKLAGKIKQLDPDHLVVLGNGDLATVSVAAQYNSHIDVLGSVCYRGKSFGNFWRETDREWKKPVLMLEFGCDAYDAYKKCEDQQVQADFVKSQWKEIAENAMGGLGFGNSLGGFLFEWCDEWWKREGGSLTEQDTDACWSNGAYWKDIKAESNMNMNEEWWGMVAQDKTIINGLNMRQPRLVYEVIQQMFTGKKIKREIKIMGKEKKK
ncbi:MAG: glycoside hydrolase family 2 TIM barrel-domain containing protein [bacterium]|nr:glycoside hydrolase family 2 TIM barrel-domain containing protein [bacterium]